MIGRLDNDEKELLESLEKDEWSSVLDLEQHKKVFQSIAKNTFNKTKRVNLRLTEYDFEQAHIKAYEEGLPYQTLLSSVIHKYLTGQLKEQ